MRAVLLGLMLLSFSTCWPQGNETVMLPPAHVRHLAGLVTDRAGAVIPSAVVEDCDATFAKVLASTRTDTNGRFQFLGATRGSTHYLRVRYPGFDLARVKVSVRTFSLGHLVIRLAVGT